ncbi:hypothetical protein Scep_014019 [Stephania cephalantha]|uniref:Uncharacterized protein n=1 Tax=Stephania cephalantha TaxID=152367 RepID=A0AAP0J0J5_9MAGN
MLEMCSIFCILRLISLLHIEISSALVAPDKNEDTMKTDTAERNSQDVNVANISRQNPHAVEEEVKLDKEGIPGRLNFTQGANLDNTNIIGDVYMEEASVTSDDVVRAGGFGARDDIGSFLPVAIDSTDFEASLRDARDYEEPQEQINRPGLGWTGAMESERR